MAYSDDPTSAPAPFSGDGGVFDHPDVLLQSPVTQERVVDTQSGFLVVVRRLEERLGLSFKRRVGTPPTSSIVLTPDESLKLSRILSSSISGLGDPAADDLFSGDLISSKRRLSLGSLSFGAKPGRTAARRSGPRLAVIVLLSGLALGLCCFFVGQHYVQPVVKATPVDPLSASAIDRFARLFVSGMLDFNPDTYKVSQIQAMSYMSPELLQKYWDETNFPLTRRQLRALPQGTTVIITRIARQPLDAQTACVDIFAELVKPGTKISSPVHLKLKLGVNEEGGIRVLEQEDLTAGIH